MTPFTVLAVSVAPSVTAPVSGLAIGASFTLVSVSFIFAVVLFPAMSVAITEYICSGVPDSKLLKSEATPAAVKLMSPVLLI